MPRNLRGTIKLNGCESEKPMILAELRPRSRDKGFVKAYDTMLIRLSTHSLNGSTLRLMLFMVGSMSYDNVVQKSQADMADKLTLSRKAVNESIKHLSDLDLIRKHQSFGNVTFWMVNPYLACKVDPKAFFTVSDVWESLRANEAVIALAEGRSAEFMAKEEQRIPVASTNPYRQNVNLTP